MQNHTSLSEPRLRSRRAKFLVVDLGRTMQSTLRCHMFCWTHTLTAPLLDTANTSHMNENQLRQQQHVLNLRHASLSPPRYTHHPSLHTVSCTPLPVCWPGLEHQSLDDFEFGAAGVLIVVTVVGVDAAKLLFGFILRR
jgi:hypothetical protein